MTSGTARPSGSAGFQGKGHVGLGSRAARVSQGLGLGAPGAEPDRVVQSPGLGRGGADAEVNPRNAGQRRRVIQDRAHEPRGVTAAPVAGGDVHAPDVGLVEGLAVAVPVEAHASHQMLVEGAEDDGLRGAPQLLPQRLRIQGEVVLGRSGEGQRRIEQGLAAQRQPVLHVLFAQQADHAAPRLELLGCAHFEGESPHPGGEQGALGKPQAAKLVGDGMVAEAEPAVAEADSEIPELLGQMADVGRSFEERVDRRR